MINNKWKVIISITLLVLLLFVYYEVNETRERSKIFGDSTFSKENVEAGKILSEYDYINWSVKDKEDLNRLIYITDDSPKVIKTYLDLYIGDNVLVNATLTNNSFDSWKIKEKMYLVETIRITTESVRVRKAYFDLAENALRKKVNEKS